MSDITILDGATGTALRARGVKVPNYKSSIWSALAVLDAPEAIVDLHYDYIMAGAEVITANNYSLTRPMLSRENMEDRLAEMIEASIKLAIKAREKAGRPDVKIAASLPPLNTTYRVDLVGSYGDNLKAYREIVAVAAPLVDMFICETLTTAEESLAAATAGCESGLPVWSSWTLSPVTASLRGGDTLEEAVNTLEGLPIEGFLFNCSACETASQAIKELRKLTDKPIGAYCNPVMQEPLDQGEPEYVPSVLMSAKEYAAVAKDWIDSGATLIGGCCDTDPSYIAELSKLKASG